MQIALRPAKRFVLHFGILIFAIQNSIRIEHDNLIIGMCTCAAHVWSHLEYAGIVCNPYYAVHWHRIESVQKQIHLFAFLRQYLRFMFF